MRAGILCICALITVLAGPARAQQPGPNPIEQSFFAPELVMQNQDAIGLTDEQKSSIRAGLRQAQQKFMDWQWKLQDEVERMATLVRQPHVDEQQALAQLENVLTIEREIKRTQIALLAQIKNKLTPEQQAKLQEMRRKAGGN